MESPQSVFDFSVKKLLICYTRVLVGDCFSSGLQPSYGFLIDFRQWVLDGFLVKGWSCGFLIDFVKDAKGNDVGLSIYRGKVLLIVNVASKCGMTNSNYTELNQLYENYRDQGLEILAFPCNQFGEEEPGSNDQVLDFVCTRFKSDFPIFGKIEVNGDAADPLYKFLKLGKWGIFGDDIQWNFAKFLVDRNGQPVDRYYPTTSPLTVERDIRKLLGLL
ncbi:UNVERIFIED_CONTAM: putative glutathione peroxidase 8 [Sesamum latifolium]|uniref:Glutathione peroxidase n=1 Tax=Sesamum latifolium TaxID=2727402 RepID=A0AAW2X5G2_9LAMI